MTDARGALITEIIVAPLIIAFLIVWLGIRSNHIKKHGTPMSVVSVIGLTLGIWAIVLVFMSII